MAYKPKVGTRSGRFIIPKTKGRYEIGRDGTIYRRLSGQGARAGKALKPRLDRKGFPEVRIPLGKEARASYHAVRGLAYMAYHGEFPFEKDIVHVDGDIENFDRKNLKAVDRVFRGQRLGKKERLSRLIIRATHTLIRSGFENDEIVWLLSTSYRVVEKVRKWVNELQRAEQLKSQFKLEDIQRLMGEFDQMEEPLSEARPGYQYEQQDA